MSSHRPAGGLKSKNVTERPVRVGPGVRAIDKNWVGQIGSSQGNHITEKGRVLRDHRASPYRGESFRPAALGNALVNNVGAGGPGTGRTIYKSGAQQGLKPPRPMPGGRALMTNNRR